AAATNNDALVVFTSTNGTSPNDLGDIRGIRVSSSGAFSQSDILLSGLASKVSNVDVAGLTDGRFVYVYQDTDDILAGFFNPATGTGINPVHLTTSHRAFDPAVAATPDGGFVLTYTDLTPSPATDVSIARYDYR